MAQVPPNYLGTQSNLTGIPSLLLSGLQNVQDPVVQTALYQIQNWANSFYTWMYNVQLGNYVTGGATVDFAKPFASNVEAIAFAPMLGAGGSQVAIVFGSLTTVGFKAQIFTSTGTEYANGSGYEFSYIAVGH